jgi:hypothetical protein
VAIFVLATAATQAQAEVRICVQTPSGTILTLAEDLACTVANLKQTALARICMGPESQPLICDRTAPVDTLTPGDGLLCGVSGADASSGAGPSGGQVLDDARHTRPSVRRALGF